jgi:hypothetical protein
MDIPAKSTVQVATGQIALVLATSRETLRVQFIDGSGEAVARAVDVRVIALPNGHTFRSIFARSSWVLCSFLGEATIEGSAVVATGGRVLARYSDFAARGSFIGFRMLELDGVRYTFCPRKPRFHD